MRSIGKFRLKDEVDSEGKRYCVRYLQTRRMEFRGVPSEEILCNLCRKIRPGLGAKLHLDGNGRSIIVCASCWPQHVKLDAAWRQVHAERQMQFKPFHNPPPLTTWTPVNEPK